MKKYTNKELGEILTNETIHISKMFMDAENTKTMDRKYWMFLHLGFIACLRLYGKTEKDVDSILDIVQKEFEIMN